jgi:proteasome accessory factor B
MAQKIQRWLDLLAALLRRNYPIPFEELIQDVPGYQDPDQAAETRRRMFERDKDELRAFGVPIATRDLGDNETGYQLDRREFYLPYLAVLREGQVEGASARVDRFGYRALPILAFEPDELEALASVGPRLRGLGIPSLLDDARSALRKLGADLPLTAPAPVSESPLALVFDTLDDALERRKRVSFSYRSMSSGTHATRRVEPYGLFFLGHHWYLAAREEGAEPGQVKNYRLSRMENVSVNAKRPGTPDYSIPGEFVLRDHARSKRAWELGDADAIECVVRMVQASGASRAVTRLGEPVAGEPDWRLFRVRRMETFARWLLGFAGSVTPVSPDELVAEYRSLAERTLAQYEGVP